MFIGVARETAPGERRVAVIPVSAAALSKSGASVLVEEGAGVAAGYPDADYREHGAEIVSREDLFTRADLLLLVGEATGTSGPDLRSRLREGQTVIGMLDPLGDPGGIRQLAQRRVRAFALELMPRITRAQSMDVLSSMATVTGCQAVLEAAARLPRLMPMMMTAAGTLAPARVFVVGVGVAGLQVIATARRLGAVVSAYDVRPAVKDQVRSVGAKFVEFDLETAGSEDAGGYAREQSEEFLRRQQEQMRAVVVRNDVVITTAAIPGKKAPVLVTEPMVRGMAPGSVIVDLAAERGGNCELTVPGEVVERHGVTIVGLTDLASRKAYHASQMYSRNVETFLKVLLKDGDLAVDTEDEIVTGTLVCDDGAVVHPRVRKLLEAAGAAGTEGEG